MKAFPVTVSLALNLLLLAITVGAAAWRLWLGKRARDRRQTLAGALILLAPGGALLLLIWPHAAYLWTETIWYAHFTRDGSPAGYDDVLWRIIGERWSVFGTYAALGTGFVAANVLAARSTCRLAAGPAQWAAYSTRAFHRTLLVCGAVGACLLATSGMRAWEAFVHADAYDKGVGYIPALVSVEPLQVGAPGHDASPSAKGDTLSLDVTNARRALTDALEEAFAASPNVSIVAADAVDRHARATPHFNLTAHAMPTSDGAAYHVYLELSGASVLKATNIRSDSRNPVEMLRHRATHSNVERFQTTATAADLGEACRALVARLAASDTLRDGFSDPVFHRNIGYYLFAFPRARWLSLWVKALLWITLGIVAYQYRYYYHRDTRSMPRAVRGIAVHTSVLWAALLVVGVWRARIASLGLLFATPNFIKSGRVPYGVSYVDLIQVGAFRVYMVALVVLVAVLAVNAILRRRRVWMGVGIAWVAAYVVLVWGYPALISLIRVYPDPMDADRAFLATHIGMTRRAYGLDGIEESRTVRDLADFSDIVARPEVLKNVQLWDRRVVWERLQQSHTIQRYYEFYPYPDVDRYTIDGELRQVVIAAREVNLSSGQLSKADWVARRTRYTHGYGVTMAPVNEAEDPGVPRFWLKGMPMQAPEGDEYAHLDVRRPEVYYGELTDTYTLVGTTSRELDYTVDAASRYTTYEGTGGVSIGVGDPLRRWAFASRLRRPLRVATSRALTKDTRVMLHRNVLPRAKRLAPFLKFDPDPFIVIGQDTGKLWWIIDLYTTTDHFPYAMPFEPRDENNARIRDLGGDIHDEPDFRRLNYIRNSAVAVVDAYNGAVRFYVTDEDDPLITVYRSHYPELFSPVDEMPTELRAHLRYPDYMLWAQAAMYTTYHVEDPIVFRTDGDAWRLPRELFHSDELQPMMPHYTVMNVPGRGEEFVGVMPFVPFATTQRLAAWLVAGSDGDNYGRLTCYILSRSEEVDGPQQIENRIDQDTELSAQFTLLGQGGSEVIRGNLLLLPVLTEEGKHALVYAEPVYLRATSEEGTSMPELKFVVIVADDKLGSDTTFQAALRAVFRVGELGIVAGVVTDESGSPVSEAVVSVYTEAGEPLPGAAVTDPSGAYRIETVMPGKYGVRIAREGYATIAEDIEITAGVPLSLSRAMTPTPATSGAARTLADVARSANSALDDYLRFTGAGRLIDAAEALERLRDDLADLRTMVEGS